jgi:hypothetical protein
MKAAGLVRALGPVRAARAQIPGTDDPDADERGVEGGCEALERLRRRRSRFDG